MSNERHVVMAWEAGSGFGHIGKLVPLTKLFRREGWRVTLVLQRLEQAKLWFDPADVSLLLAPLHNGHISRRLKTVNTSSLLSEIGWLDDCVLQSQLRGWLSLLDVLKPQLLMCEYAPVAMLAARFRQSIATVSLGASFSVPVLGTPMPLLRWWVKDPVNNSLEVAARHDGHILKVVNTVLQRENLPLLQTMEEMWLTDARILCSLPPLDYGTYLGKPRRCWGILEQAAGGEAPVWPDEGREKVFAYLRPGLAHFEIIMQALQKLDLCSLVVSSGISAELKERYNRGCLKISPLVNMKEVCEQATLIIGNGTLGLASQAMRAGIPTFMSPLFLEQRLNSMGAFKAGACLLIEQNPTVDGVARQLQQLLTEPRFRQAAYTCSQLPEAKRSDAEVAEEITRHCIALAENKMQRSSVRGN